MYSFNGNLLNKVWLNTFGMIQHQIIKPQCIKVFQNWHLNAFLFVEEYLARTGILFDDISDYWHIQHLSYSLLIWHKFQLFYNPKKLLWLPSHFSWDHQTWFLSLWQSKVRLSSSGIPNTNMLYVYVQHIKKT